MRMCEETRRLCEGVLKNKQAIWGACGRVVEKCMEEFIHYVEGM